MNKPRPNWKHGSRFRRIGEFAVNAAPEELFPLLCPVREYDWIPDWRCTMVFSESGAAEKDTIFHTAFAFGKKVVWTLITFEPASFVEYLMVSGTDAVVRLSIGLASDGSGGTRVHWEMLFTSSSRLGTSILRRHFSEEAFHAMMTERRDQLNRYFARAG